MDEVWATIARAYRMLQGDLSLEPWISLAVRDSPPVVEALIILGVAVVSVMIGHGIVLLLNRVPVAFAAASLGVGVVVLLALRLVQALTVWGVATLLTGRPVSASVMAVMSILALAPQVLAVIIALPHVGLFLGRLLEAWGLVIPVTLVAGVYEISRWVALAVVGAAWLAVQVASRLLAEPARNLGSRAWTRASGRPTLVTAQDVLSGTPYLPVDARTATS